MRLQSTLLRLAAFLILIWCGASSAQGQGKVFTNDDFPQAPPPAPAPPAAAPEAAPAPAPQAASQAAPAAQPSPAPAGPPSEYQNALTFQQALQTNLQELQSKLATEENEARRARWTSMIGCVQELLTRNQDTLNELSRQMQTGSGPGPSGS